MLPDTVNPDVSLLESDAPQVNLVRWMHQCELVKRYYQADYVFVMQKTKLGYEVLVSAIARVPKFTSGQVFGKEFSLFDALISSPPDGLSLNLSRYSKEELPKEFDGCLGLLSRPLLWPDGTLFGCMCILNHHPMENAGLNGLMLEPFQILLQQDLALLCQSHRIESLSMRDRDTGMLNHYGFIMMAPRQLNLGRRFGAHAGILFFELLGNDGATHEEIEKNNRLLGNIVQSTIRTADIAAHFSPSEFVVLAFVDAERDLMHIVNRVDRQLKQQSDNVGLDYSFRYFTPDSTAKLAPMLAMAREDLQSHRRRQAELANTSDDEEAGD
ncbi:GGDEF domain-containing protein [Shewanella cyperi]|uniref:GGDEF domain-containing protein n=1 Tax=Shewanella cyperi TaxID=2814292 RepID=A0A974XIX9_9GAMM|nr:GGDEF domain-containing protein [Shewanella cyperi]QSX29255.1 GGDEF domain-containing protein [Shewanella cyperi]QSX40000.1 GGDEF domain-containing protein [Shewanella cyperi]